jgi:hypothetical protein
MEGTRGSPRSWIASTYEDEKTVLESFWDAVDRMPSHALWVTFNGKQFDVPFLTARTAHHGLMPTRTDILNTVPYRHKPHADLSTLWRPHYGLDDMCVHLGIESPKSDMDGSRVAQAVADGRLDAVARYCEQDVIATLECLTAVQWVV